MAKRYTRKADGLVLGYGIENTTFVDLCGAMSPAHIELAGGLTYTAYLIPKNGAQATIFGPKFNTEAEVAEYTDDLAARIGATNIQEVDNDLATPEESE